MRIKIMKMMKSKSKRKVRIEFFEIGKLFWPHSLVSPNRAGLGQVRRRVRQPQVQNMIAAHVHNARQKSIPSGGKGGPNGLGIGDGGVLDEIFMDLVAVQPQSDLVIRVQQDCHASFLLAIDSEQGVG